MKKENFLLIAFLLLAGCAGGPISDQLHHSGKVMGYEIPYHKEIVADGLTDDWSGIPGYRLYFSRDQAVAQQDDFKGRVCFAWNEDGLAFLVDVVDDTVSYNGRDPWQTDGVEFFLTPGYGNDNLLQFAATARVGSSPDSGLVTLDYRKDREIGGEISWKTERRMTDHGYVVEGYISTSALGIGLEDGAEAGIQLYINDLDGDDMERYALFYATGIHNRPKALYPFRLVHQLQHTKEKQHQVSAALVDYEEMVIKVVTTMDTAEAICLFHDGTSMQTVRSDVEGKALFEKRLSADETDHSKPIYVMMNDRILEVIDLQYINRLYIHASPPYPFEETIRAYELQDEEDPPPAHATLVIGSSSIRRWNTIEDDLEGTKIIARGFGGSKAQDVLHYMDRIVLPYKPARIVYYEGDNDIASGMTAEAFIDSTKRFISLVHEQLPGTEFFLLSVKPSIRRMHLWEEMSKANLLLEQLASTDTLIHFVDVASGMFLEDGTLNEEIFVRDGVHMNDEGYAIWTAVIREALGIGDHSGAGK